MVFFSSSSLYKLLGFEEMYWPKLPSSLASDVFFLFFFHLNKCVCVWEKVWKKSHERRRGVIDETSHHGWSDVKQSKNPCFFFKKKHQWWLSLFFSPFILFGFRWSVESFNKPETIQNTQRRIVMNVRRMPVVPTVERVWWWNAWGCPLSFDWVYITMRVGWSLEFEC